MAAFCLAVFRPAIKAIITWLMIRMLHTADSGIFFLGMLLSCFFGSDEGLCQPSLDFVLFPGVAVVAKYVESQPNPHEHMLDTWILFLAAFYLVLGDRFRASLLGVWLPYFYMDIDLGRCCTYATLALTVLMSPYIRRAYQMFWPPVSALLYDNVKTASSGLSVYVISNIGPVSPLLPLPPSPLPPPPTPLTLSPVITTANIEPSKKPTPTMVDSNTQISFPTSSPTMADSSVQTSSLATADKNVQASPPTMIDSSTQTSSPTMANSGMQTSSTTMADSGMQTSPGMMADSSMQTCSPTMTDGNAQQEKEVSVKPYYSPKATMYHVAGSGIMSVPPRSRIPVSRISEPSKVRKRSFGGLTRRASASKASSPTIPSTEPVILADSAPSSLDVVDPALIPLPLEDADDLNPTHLSQGGVVDPALIPLPPDGMDDIALISKPQDVVDPSPISSEPLCELAPASSTVYNLAPNPNSDNVSTVSYAPISTGAEPILAAESADLMTIDSLSCPKIPDTLTTILAPAPESSFEAEPTPTPCLPLTALPLNLIAFNWADIPIDTEEETKFLFGNPVDEDGDIEMGRQLIQDQKGSAMGDTAIRGQELPLDIDSFVKFANEWESGFIQRREPLVAGNFAGYRDNTDAESDDGYPPSKSIGPCLDDEDYFIPVPISRGPAQTLEHSQMIEYPPEFAAYNMSCNEYTLLVEDHPQVPNFSPFDNEYVQNPAPESDDEEMTDEEIDENESKDSFPRVIPNPRWMCDGVEATSAHDDDMDEDTANFDMSSIAETLLATSESAQTAVSTSSIPFSTPAWTVPSITFTTPPTPTIPPSAARKVLVPLRISRRLTRPSSRPVRAAQHIMVDLTPSADAPKLDNRFIVPNSPTRPVCNILSLDPNYRPERNLGILPRIKTPYVEGYEDGGYRHKGSWALREHPPLDQDAVLQSELLMDEAADEASKDWPSRKAGIEEQTAQDTAAMEKRNKVEKEKAKEEGRKRLKAKNDAFVVDCLRRAEIKKKKGAAAANPFIQPKRNGRR
ncbi:hypothetical protein F5Y10DRAFT_264582 [Nemania abortiva]|nr:hypothetical protein F5Y10DRAFT_264582 [Nemania abortiva]